MAKYFTGATVWLTIDNFGIKTIYFVRGDFSKAPWVLTLNNKLWTIVSVFRPNEHDAVLLFELNFRNSGNKKCTVRKTNRRVGKSQWYKLLKMTIVRLC